MDDDLALLIDSALPDRNRNGVYGFVDANHNGRWDAGEPMNDFDSARSVNRDQVLGYRDGFIDKRDQYAKVRGRLAFRASAADWESGQGSIDERVRGPIRADRAEAAQTYEASDQVLPDLDPADFADANAALSGAANGAAFAAQVASNLGITVGQLATYVETNPAGSSSPRYLRVDPDDNLDGLPDNSGSAYFERVPYGSPTSSDWYYRPVYENMNFKDVVIPMGNNGLFRNCTFAGVTRVQTTTANTHLMWTEYGRMALSSATNRPAPTVARSVYGDGAGETSYPAMLPSTAVPPNQMILMAATPLDKADIPANQSGGSGYDSLPEPLVIGGLRVTDTKAYSNNVRFHDCLFVGSIVSDAPSAYTQVRNKLQFTGSTRFQSRHPDAPDDPDLNPEDDDLPEIAKSSMMLPNYSVDIGSFNSPPEQDVRLHGAIVAGVLDIRGNTDVDGALLLTFAPVLGEGPLRDAQGNPAGNPAGFNTSIGYFGPDDGDAESLDPESLPVVDGERIVGWDLDGDGLADLGPDENPTQAQLDAGAQSVPFYGYGRIHIHFDGEMVLPDGLMLPMQVRTLAATYREGNP